MGIFLTVLMVIFAAGIVYAVLCMCVYAVTVAAGEREE